jgi:hypothetical protein
MACHVGYGARLTFKKSILPFGERASQYGGENSDECETGSYCHDVITRQVSSEGSDIVNGDTHGHEGLSDCCEVV